MGATIHTSAPSSHDGLLRLAPARFTRAYAANHRKSISARRRDDSVTANGKVTSKARHQSLSVAFLCRGGACGEQKSPRPLSRHSNCESAVKRPVDEQDQESSGQPRGTGSADNPPGLEPMKLDEGFGLKSSFENPSSVPPLTMNSSICRRRTSAWLSQNRCDDQWGINWPNAVALTPLELNGDGSRLTSEKTLSGPSRAAWCYGAPGIARALWLAGLALQDSNLIEIAVSSLHAVTRRPKADRAIDSPTFCHGVAGLLQIMLRSVNETEDSLLIGEVRLLVEQILSLWDPESYLGFRSIEPGERFVDQPGFLDGAAGVAITLLSAASDEPPSWDRLFMLA